MKPGDLQLKTTSGLKYFILSERTTKNHPRVSDNEYKSQSVRMAWPGNPVVLWLALRSTWQKEIHEVIPFGRNRKTTMQVLSVQQMRSGFVMYLWGRASWRIS